MVVLPNNMAFGANAICHPMLWPQKSLLTNSIGSYPQETIKKIVTHANKLIDQSTHPVKQLSSAGKTNINDASLIASRVGFKDADHAALLALTYYLTRNQDYFNKTRQVLLDWSHTNQPTGNPIDETRLEGMIWAYDLIACDLSLHDNKQIRDWFNQIRLKKIAWVLGPTTTMNNHRIHQLKMLLLIDIVLNRHEELKKDILTVKKYCNINLDPNTGRSYDYRQRTALYYHNYDLQPWLEITLISEVCRRPVIKAFQFLSKQILSGHMNHEFSQSQAKIDMLRAHGGFGYAKKNGTFDVTKAAPTIVMFYTIVDTRPNEKLWHIVRETTSPWLEFLKARRQLWHLQRTST